MSLQHSHQKSLVKLSRVNLNLLPHLSILLETASVSEAARIACVAQSTMSKTLAQLRDFFQDPVTGSQG